MSVVIVLGSEKARNLVVEGSLEQFVDEAKSRTEWVVVRPEGQSRRLLVNMRHVVAIEER